MRALEIASRKKLYKENYSLSV